MAGGERKPPDERRCTAEAKRGGQCPGWKITGTELCMFHTPKLGGAGRKAKPIEPGEARAGWPARREAQEEKARGVAEIRLKLRTLETIPATLETIADEVASGVLGVQKGGVLAQLARAAIQAHVAIDELQERAHKRRLGATDEQIQAALEQLREAQQRRQEALS